MGDETMENDVSFYLHSGCSYVLRNYWNAEYERQYDGRAHWVPLGTKTGVGINGFGFGASAAAWLVPASQRSLLCNFIGSLRSHRQHMLDAVAPLGCVLQHSTRWADPKGVLPYEYRRVLLNSKFTLAPWGNNPESLRLYEALEFGSIPICIRFPDPNLDTINALHHYGGRLGPVPWPVLGSWEEAVVEVRRLMADPAALDKLQERTMNWWMTFRRASQLRIKHIIDQSFAEAYGPDE
jgi:hypothetical protein